MMLEIGYGTYSSCDFHKDPLLVKWADINKKYSVLGLDTNKKEDEKNNLDMSSLLLKLNEISVENEDDMTKTLYRIWKEEQNIPENNLKNFFPLKRMVLSKHVLLGMDKTIHKLSEKFPDQYLLCMQYRKRYVKVRLAWDVQIGITETLTKQEYSMLSEDPSHMNLRKVVKRALKEELCKNITGCSYSLYGEYNDTGRSLYAVSVLVDKDSKVEHYTNVEPTKEANCSNKSKIMLFMHGPMDVMVNLFNKFSTTEDEICSYVLVKLSEAKTLFFN